MLPNAPLGAQLKRVWRHPKNYLRLLLIDLHSLHQRADQLAAGLPIRDGEPGLDLRGERLEPAQDQP
jgi:hypothetical protein